MTAPDGRPAPVVMAAVELSGVVVRYASGRLVTALDDVSLHVEAGEVVAVCGRNGAGKTTLLDVVTGFVRPAAGGARVLGIDPRAATASQRARVGIALAENGLPPAASARRLLGHLGRLHRDPVPLDDLVDRLHLAGFVDRRIRRLSTGERQRVAVACALLGRPDLLVLDEPTSALDIDSRRAVLDLIREARNSGAAVLWSSHTLSDVARGSDRVVVLDHGRVLAAGAPQALVGAVDVVRFDAGPARDTAPLHAALPAGMTVAETAPGSYEVAGVGVDAGVLTTVSTWQAANAGSGRLSVGPRDLEDVLASLTVSGQHELAGRGGR